MTYSTNFEPLLARNKRNQNQKETTKQSIVVALRRRWNGARTNTLTGFNYNNYIRKDRAEAGETKFDVFRTPNRPYLTYHNRAAETSRLSPSDRAEDQSCGRFFPRKITKITNEFVTSITYRHENCLNTGVQCTRTRTADSSDACALHNLETMERPCAIDF